MVDTTADDILVSSIEEVRRHGEALMEAHYREVATHRDRAPLAVDWSHYRVLEKAGLLLVLTAWEHGDLIGYTVTTIAPHPHHSILVALNDGIFVSPVKRNQGHGLRLIRRTEIEAHRKGAKLFRWHAPANSTLAKLFGSRLDGYAVDETVFCKEL